MNSISTFPKLQPPLSPNDFEFLSLIGEGKFSQVWLVRSKGDGELSALKSLRIDGNSKDESIELSQLIKNEIRSLSRLDPSFPFIAHLKHPTFSNLNDFFIPLEYVSGGDLFEHLLRYGPINESRARLYVTEIGFALDYLHSRGIIFRDLKSENILISDDGHLKLTDFGLSTTDQNEHSSICGTPHTIAPEILRKGNYDHKVDWYSLGSCMFEMLTGRPPFYQLLSNLPALIHSILHIQIKLPKFISKDARLVLSSLLAKDPSNRIGCLSELLNSNWLECIHVEDLKAKLIKPEFIPANLLKSSTPSNTLKVFRHQTAHLLDAKV